MRSVPRKDTQSGSSELSVETKLDQFLDDSHIYWSGRMFNNTNGDLPAQIIDQRANELIKDPSKYHMCLVRASIPATHVPIRLWVDNQFKLSIQYSGVDYSSTLTFTPSAAGSLSNNGYVYYFEQVIQSINNSLATAWSACSSAATLTGAAPYMGWDPTTQLFSLYAEKLRFDIISNPSAPKIFFNTPLYRLFPSLQALYYNFNAIYNAFQIYVTDNQINNTAGLLKMTEDVSTVSIWTTVQGFAFMSNSLPVRGEAISSDRGSSSNVEQKIIFDLEMPVGIAPGSGLVFQYNATSDLRSLDLLSNQSIRTVDVSVYVVYKDGTYELLQIEPSEVVTVKLLFRKISVTH